MVGIARIVAPGTPYHVTHRGNQRRAVFFCDRDRELYLADLAVWAHDCGLSIWGYCLMTNHVHLVAVPQRAESMARAIGRVHQRHARRVHASRGVTGHLWANRFYSSALDEQHLWMAIRYVELNPVRAGLTVRAEAWPWSSASAHCAAQPEVAGAPLLDRGRPFGASRPHPLTGVPMAWGDWLAMGLAGEADASEQLRRATLTGRPCGSKDFVECMERQLGRSFECRKPGPKPSGAFDEDDNQYELF